MSYLEGKDQNEKKGITVLFIFVKNEKKCFLISKLHTWKYEIHIPLYTLKNYAPKFNQIG